MDHKLGIFLNNLFNFGNTLSCCRLWEVLLQVVNFTSGDLLRKTECNGFGLTIFQKSSVLRIDH